MFVSMNECPFCEKESIAKVKFLESELCNVVYNRSPIVPGHSLIIPKRHINSLLDLTNEEMNDFMQTSCKAIKVLRKAFSKKDFNFSIQDGPEADQTIPHLHAHILLRTKGDFDGNIHTEIADSSKRPKLDDEKMSEIVSNLREIAASLV